jgi:predicted RecB family nuclease
LLLEKPEETEYLFALDIEKSIVKKEHLERKHYNYYEYEDWVYIKLDKYNYTNFEDIDEIVKELVEKIKESV